MMSKSITRANKNDQLGFTLIEMLVIAPIVILAIGAFLTVIISMTGEVIASRASNALSYDVQDALNKIEQDVKQSTSFLATNNITLVDIPSVQDNSHQGYNNDTTAFPNIGGPKGASLVLNMVATTGNPISTTSGFVRLKDKPDSCANSQNNIPLTYNVVYFVKNNPVTNRDVLWRRVIMPNNYTDSDYRCTAPWQQPSCNPVYIEATPSDTFCKTGDTKLVEANENELTLALQYYNGASTVLANSAAVTGADSVRGLALQSSTTVGVAVNAKQTTAGREVERSAVLRASRLETNASSIAILTDTTTPSAPVVSANFSPGAKAVFTWPAVSGASGYTFEYNLNGGGWTTVFTNQTTRTATVSAGYNSTNLAANKNVVNARVTAINAAGSSGYGTKSATIPIVETMNLQNGWASYDTTYSGAQYSRTSAGVVVLQGLIKRNGSIVSEEIIATLPVGYRPSSDIIVPIIANAAMGRLRILANGEIHVTSASANWTSLSGISFLASDANYTPTTYTPLNSWVTYSAVYGTPSYTLDTEGRVNMQALLRSGTVTGGTNLFTMPVGSPALRPITYTYMPQAPSSTSFAYVIVYTDGTMTVWNANATYTSFNGQYYTSTRTDATPNDYSGNNCTTKWCTPGTSPTYALSNGWVAYDGPAHRFAQFTQASDGIMTLRGLIKSGTTTNDTVIFNLPSGMRPSARLIFLSNCNGALCRIDIHPNGNVLTSSFVSAAYSSLDLIRFIPE